MVAYAAPPRLLHESCRDNHLAQPVRLKNGVAAGPWPPKDGMQLCQRLGCQATMLVKLPTGHLPHNLQGISQSSCQPRLIGSVQPADIGRLGA